MVGQLLKEVAVVVAPFPRHHRLSPRYLIANTHFALSQPVSLNRSNFTRIITAMVYVFPEALIMPAMKSY